ncbi:MAG: hypothetical protein KC777_23605 [Cyanobacteria bacterium HKST-UBA02]|nr:hypothetical protein [Cyanobacteria bacterium HKST-UBA02]
MKWEFYAKNMNSRKFSLFKRRFALLFLATILLSGCRTTAELLHGSRIGYFYGQGLSMVREGRYHEAVAALSRGLEVESNPGLYAVRGFAYGKLGQYDNALKDFDSSLSSRRAGGVDDIAAINKHLSPVEYYKESFSYACRGLARAKRGNLEDVGDMESARQDIDEAIRLDPRESAWYCFRAAVAIDSQEPDQALIDLERASALEPENPIPFHLKALALDQKGLRQEAQTSRRTAIKLDYPDTVDYTRFGVGDSID